MNDLGIGLKINDNVLVLLNRGEAWLLVCSLVSKHKPTVKLNRILEEHSKRLLKFCSINEATFGFG